MDLEEVKSEEMQEVAVPVREGAKEPEVAAPEEALSIEEGQEETQKEPGQNTEETDNTEQASQGRTKMDAAFAAMRRQLEEERRGRRESEKAVAQLTEAVRPYGFEGTPEEIGDALKAHYSQRPVEEIRQERQQQEAAQRQSRQMQQELELLRSRERQRILEADLKKVQQMDPNIHALADLGLDFLRMKQAGVETEVAYRAVMAQRAAHTPVAPKPAGRVEAPKEGKKDFYSSSEVDRMSEAELDDPKVLEQVIRSMNRW